MADAFYLPLDDEGAFTSTQRTSGPWDPGHQHAGPPAALVGRALLRAGAASGLVCARMTFELLGPVPVDEVHVRAEVVRPGRRVQMVEATLESRGRVAVRARAWQVAGSPAPDAPPAGPPPPALPDHDVPPPAGWNPEGYLGAIEWRYAHGGGLDEPGAAAAWTRPRIPLVAGEPIAPLERVLLVADSGNGISARLDIADWLFINTELTMHVLREPRGEWVLLDAETSIAHGGAGLARSTLSDAEGVVGHGAQALLVAPR